MSRIGKLPVTIPDKVTVTLTNQQISVKGPKGELSRELNPLITVVQEDNALKVSPTTSSLKAQQIHGLYRRLIANMILGVSQGFERKLILQGVGYRSQVQGKKTNLKCRF
jgi:large subunit ribosomal protein L6